MSLVVILQQNNVRGGRRRRYACIWGVLILPFGSLYLSCSNAGSDHESELGSRACEDARQPMLFVAALGPSS